jgi:hypothetical protein
MLLKSEPILPRTAGIYTATGATCALTIEIYIMTDAISGLIGATFTTIVEIFAGIAATSGMTAVTSVRIATNNQHP